MMICTLKDELEDFEDDALDAFMESDFQKENVKYQSI